MLDHAAISQLASESGSTDTDFSECLWLRLCGLYTVQCTSTVMEIPQHNQSIKPIELEIPQQFQDLFADLQNSR